MRSESSSSGICPWATPMRASGTSLFQVAAHGVDGLHAVVDEEDLPAALQLAQDGLAHQASANRARRG